MKGAACEGTPGWRSLYARACTSARCSPDVMNWRHSYEGTCSLSASVSITSSWSSLRRAYRFTSLGSPRPSAHCMHSGSAASYASSSARCSFCSAAASASRCPLARSASSACALALVRSARMSWMRAALGRSSSGPTFITAISAKP